MDFHDKFGLSPINVDRVDLQRFPSFANATTYVANLHAGDIVYLPDGWWHAIKSFNRNVAIALEMHPYSGDGPWPARLRRRKDAKGVFWAEQIAIQQAMREQLADKVLSAATRKPIKCDSPLAESPQSLAEVKHMGHDD